MKIVFSLMMAAFLFVSCSTMDVINMVAKPKAQTTNSDVSPDSSAAPAQGKVDVSAELAKYQSMKASGKSYPASADLSTAAGSYTALKGGEWSVYRSFDGGKIQGIVKFAVVGKQDNAWIYEFVSYSSDGATAMQMAIQGLDDVMQSGDANKGKLLWLKVKDKDGKVSTIDGAMLGANGNSYKGIVTGFGYASTAAVTAGGAVTVPAGTFASTWKVESKMSHGRASGSGVAYVSSLVPLYRLIKVVSDDGRYTMELVDFGTSGYVSALN